MGEDGKVTRARCPQREHAPLHPAEVEAWRILGFMGAWRLRPHPRWNDAALPVIDLTAARAAHDASRARWSDVLAILGAIEPAARKVAREEKDAADV